MDSAIARSITDEEVAFFRDHGFVLLPQLISPDTAAQLLERAKQIMGSDASEHRAREGIDSANNPWQDRHDIIEEDPLFASVGLSKEMGANAQRLMRRDIGVLLYNNALAVKIGSRQASSAPASVPTPFHQDGASYPMDRHGVVSFWISLDHNTPEMGTVRYLDRSHQLGSLGTLSKESHLQAGHFDVYPELHELTITKPPDLKPGDAAVHAMYTLHDAAVNETDRPRWAFLVRYLPSDTIYTGAITNAQATMRKIQRAGLVAGEPFGGPEYPLVFG
jgi:ectoine hydroxylase-related dioxygenase (phytanoyl-CoA dioxygenase family)